MFKFITAKVASDITDPEHTLGIEITDPAVAAVCGVGNLDGQHRMPGTPVEWDGLAAIEIAYDCEVPVDGSTLATSRPDLDSVAAMAVLVLRSVGLANVIDYDLCATIAARDSFVVGPWEPSPLPTIENPWPRKLSTVDGSHDTAHLGMIASPRQDDFCARWPLAERIVVLALALAPSMSVEQFAAVAAVCGVSGSGDADSRIGRCKSMLALAREESLRSRIALALAALKPGAISDEAFGLVSVRVAHAGALGVGYCLAPVVVAFDQAIPGKVTIAEYGDQERRVDFDRLVQRLNAAEVDAGGSPGWGGQAKIKGSPLPRGTLLPERVICDIVRAVMSQE